MWFLFHIVEQLRALIEFHPISLCKHSNWCLCSRHLLMRGTCSQPKGGGGPYMMTHTFSNSHRWAGWTKICQRVRKASNRMMGSEKKKILNTNYITYSLPKNYNSLESIFNQHFQALKNIQYKLSGWVDKKKKKETKMMRDYWKCFHLCSEDEWKSGKKSI